MTADDNDHDHTREAPAMSEDTELTCDWCVLYSIAQPRTVSYGITVRDCCAGTNIDYLLCDQHWAILRDQRFPAECPRCGDLAATLDDIVTTVMPLGDYESSELSPDTAQYPAPANATATLLRTDTDLPNALRAVTQVTTHYAKADSDAPEASATDSSAAELIPDYDYVTMAEEIWLYRREQQRLDVDYEQYGRHIDDLSSQLREATAINDAPAAQYLDAQLAHWHQQRQLAQDYAHDSLKHDRQAFAIWRQTSDGQFFTDWVTRAFTITTWIADVDERWHQRWQELLDDTITAEERAAYDTGIWIPRTRRHTVLRYLRDTAVVTTLVGLVVAALLGPAWLALAAAGAVAAGYSIYSARDTAWESLNRAAARQSRAQRVERFGFDPLDEPDRPAPRWSVEPNPIGYVVTLQTAATTAFESHPRPDALPELHYPAVAATYTVPEGMRELLASLAPPA